MFLTIDDNPDMGLNNKICKDKKYYCKSHRVFLSEEDAQNKGCFKKMTYDMMNTRKCSWLVEVE